MRVTTRLKKWLNLQGLWVAGVRFEDDKLIILARSRRRRLRSSAQTA